MTLEVWPTTLPQSFLASGYGEAAPEKNIITDDYNVGPPIYRRRTISAPAPYAGRMFMTAAEWETLSTFFHTTLFDGVIRFLFPPQAVADTARFWISRFVSPPQRQMSDVDDGWFVSLRLEKLGIGPALAFPPVFSDPTTIYASRVIWDQFIAPSLYTNTNILYTLPTSQSLTASLYSNTNTFYAPSVDQDGEADTLLLEGGDDLLLESGDDILLEGEEVDLNEALLESGDQALLESGDNILLE